MNHTENYGFRLPEPGDPVLVDDINYNSEQTDSILKTQSSEISETKISSMQKSLYATGERSEEGWGDKSEFANTAPWNGITGKPSTFPPSAHQHSASDITSGTLPIARGGTGGSSSAAARTALDVPATSDVLTKNNTTAFTPTANYHPATKQYVDSAVAGIPGGGDMTKAVYDPGNTVATAGGILKAVYPVGSYYISAVATNPATLFGFGTWVPAAVGRMIVGVNAADTDFNAAGKNGGTKMHAHPLSNAGGAKVSAGGTAVTLLRDHTASWTGDYQATVTTGTPTTRPNAVGLIGNTDAASTMPPYETAYIWRRTA